MIGVDVSNHQGGIAWPQVPADIEFVFAKASEGTGFVDRWYRTNLAGAADRPKGGYHFAHPANGNPHGEANHFLRQLTGTETLPPVLDAEASPQATRRGNTDWCLAWLEHVEEATGRTPMFYSYGPWINDHLADDPRLARFPLWLANYGPNNGRANTPPTAPAPWSQWHIWQYTSNGSVPGMTGRIDLNQSDRIHELLDPEPQGGTEDMRIIYARKPSGGYTPNAIWNGGGTRERMEDPGLAALFGPGWASNRTEVDFDWYMGLKPVASKSIWR